MTFKRTSIFQWLIAALALVPLILYAWLGQFSRLMSSDYYTVAFGLEAQYLGGGGYANWFFKGAMAPLDTLIARITPMLIIVLWLVGLPWLVFQVLTYLKIEHSRRALSFAIAALTVAATIHAFYSPQSFLLVFAEYPEYPAVGSAHDLYGAGALDGSAAAGR